MPTHLVVGAGAIGTPLVRRLAERGDTVRVATRRGTAIAGAAPFTLDAKDAAALTNAAHGVDTIVVDLQDIGVRFYTYAATMGAVMEEAARRGITVVVLDRPNPIDGWRIEGPASDEAVLGSTSYLRMPIRHGLTIGELARPLDMSFAGASKHVRVLENAGLVDRTVAGREHRCGLRVERLQPAGDWLAACERYWSGRLDALEALVIRGEGEG